MANGWMVHRHCCGQGTCAFAWALRASAQRSVLYLQWGHRCAGLEVALPQTGRLRQSVMIIGLLSPYESAAVDICVASVVSILRSRRRPGPVVIAGDWNVDPRPGAWRGLDSDMRLRLWQSALDAMGLEARCASSVTGRPPGPQSAAALATAATWCFLREVGQQLAPRVLDWVAVAPHAQERPTDRWDMRSSDHACLFMKLPLYLAPRRRPPGHWRPADPEAPCAAWQRLAVALPPRDPESLHSYVANTVAQTQTASTARDRGRGRLPLQARQFFACAAAEPGACEARRPRDLGRQAIRRRRRGESRTAASEHGARKHIQDRDPAQGACSANARERPRASPRDVGLATTHFDLDARQQLVPQDCRAQREVRTAVAEPLYTTKRGRRSRPFPRRRSTHARCPEAVCWGEPQTNSTQDMVHVRQGSR